MTLQMAFVPYITHGTPPISVPQSGHGQVEQVVGTYAEHMRWSQNSSRAHALPQRPQLAESVWKSTHAPLHTAVGLGVHATTQAPASQCVVGAAHTWPTVPQFRGSVCKSMQPPAAIVVPGRQMHAPAEQYWSCLHCVPIVPQWVGSVCVLI